MTAFFLIALTCGQATLPDLHRQRQPSLDPAASGERAGVLVACGGGGSGGYRKPARPGHQHKQQTPEVSENT